MRKVSERRPQFSFLETVPPWAVTSSENWLVRVSTCVAGTSWRAMKTFSYNAILAPYGCSRPGVLANRPDLADPSRMLGPARRRGRFRPRRAGVIQANPRELRPFRALLARAIADVALVEDLARYCAR